MILKKYLVLAGCVLMLLFLGTNQAWSVFVRPLKAEYGFSALQMQWVFNTGTLVFCTMMIFAGRLHDRFGPRPLAVASALLIGLAWTLAWASHGSYFWLWIAIGVVGNTGNAVGYICPIATAIKWFPNHRGLVSGLAAAGFGSGPILLSGLAEGLMRHDWRPINIFGIVAVTYAPVVFAMGMTLALPPGQPSHTQVVRFRRRALVGDRRFLTLALGMFTGTLPFLVIMGTAKPLAVDFGLAESLAAIAITVLAIGNTFGRIFWGVMIDRTGPRRAMLAAQAVVIASMILLITAGHLTPALFFVSLFGVGFCYGSNFAIFPATVTRLYGAHVIGSVYPLIMAAQGAASFASTVNGFLKDATGSYGPGLILALAIAVGGSIACWILSRSISERALSVNAVGSPSSAQASAEI